MRFDDFDQNEGLTAYLKTVADVSYYLDMHYKRINESSDVASWQ